MKTKLLLIITLFLFSKSYSQKAYEIANYNGKIGESPISLELVAGDVWTGTYSYTKYNKKIIFSSEKMMYEESSQIKLKESVGGKCTGWFLFNGIDIDKNTLNGKWCSPDGNQVLNVTLTKVGKPISAADKKKMEEQAKAKMDSLFNSAAENFSIEMDTLSEEEKLSEEAKTFFAKYSSGKAFTDACKKSLPTIEDCKYVFKGQNAYIYFGYIEDIKSQITGDEKSDMEKYIATKIKIFTTSEIVNKSKGNYAGYMQTIVNKLQPNITFYGVEKIRKPTDESGMSYKYWVKIGGRWVFFPKMGDAFETKK
jgi:hypothetical protein